jgi:hypothetical protein
VKGLSQEFRKRPVVRRATPSQPEEGGDSLAKA